MTSTDTADTAPGTTARGTGAPSGDPLSPTDSPKAGFLATSLEELRKVVWPSRQQLFSESLAVILMVTLSAFAIAAVDRFYSWANTQVFR